MSIGVLLDDLNFTEFKFRLFKKFGQNTGGNPMFINSTLEDKDSFIESKEFFNLPEIYALHCIYDQEFIYRLTSLEEKKFFFTKDIKETESINLFDKDLNWVLTIFDQNMI
ncbi:hypothetical protein J8281_13955 [Aquimarina sp. U1-2]|uniref:hypothetical protein n=1 Tax=Aquimarina sp. U1-2 TaxID=2823141 RepID=UPI001AEC7940|nr:hypothetical protein [Aquimarina sp. U1-2]MBP2833294.1 hypothetical protein [Aquimarina sp. U1-2]